MRSPQQIHQQLNKSTIISHIPPNQMNRFQQIILPQHTTRQGGPKILTRVMYPDNIILHPLSARGEDIQHLSPNNEVFRAATVTSTTTTGQE